MRVLVTGATGFVGHYILQNLAQRDIEVIAVSRQPRVGNARAQWVCLADPGNAAEVARLLLKAAPEVVIHLAGVSTAVDSAALYLANVVFAANVLAAAASLSRPPRVLVAGSAAEYGPVDQGSQPVAESQFCQPNTAYGVSKLAQTGHALLARAQGLPVTVARVFNPIGAGMPATLALGSFARQIARMGSHGGVLRTGDLDVVRDFIDATQAARLLVDLATIHAGTIDLVNVCTGRGVSLKVLTQRLIELSGLPVTLEHDASRHGNSNVRSFVGSADRLRSLGLDPIFGASEVDKVLYAMLKHARASAAS